ncbi:uncharacterized protein LOC111331187 [Stylophora pistillata]|uniref:uncharacterized protein LOC111331187 n=1 Tax=Stylophora pistillata TaxID=50429 RepID=UPI000C048B6B|nr:uncharacterized protein LOC111331187 [Stylophora pistillata]
MLVTGKKGNRWSLATTRVALAVYNRIPSGFEALSNLGIPQLPCTKVLKNVLKDAAEKPGIYENYFQSQCAKYQEYQKQRESTGHPQPLEIGVMLWDEFKIQMKVAWNLKGGSISSFTMAPDKPACFR